MNEQQRLHSQDVQERAAAAEAFSLMGPEASFAATDLVQACGDDQMVAQWAVSALEELGPPPKESLADLSELARSGDSEVAYWAVTLLGRCGEASRPYEDLLARILSDSEDIALRQRSAWALTKMHAGSDTVLNALEGATRSSDPRLSRMATDALRQVRA